MQTWLMVGLAFGMLVIIFVAGRPEAPAAPDAPAAAQAQQPNPDRVRDYQDRLRALEAQAAQEEQAAACDADARLPRLRRRTPAPRGPRTRIVAERKRRDYESLFAGNVVLSRRPASERPDVAQAMATARPSVAMANARQPVDRRDRGRRHARDGQGAAASR